MFPRLQLWVVLKTSALCLGPFYQSFIPTSHARVYRIASILKTYWFWVPILHYKTLQEIFENNPAVINPERSNCSELLRVAPVVDFIFKKMLLFYQQLSTTFFKQTASQVRSSVIFRHANFVIFRHVNFVIGCANFQQAW